MNSLETEKTIDTLAKDFAFAADAEKSRRESEERNRFMNQPIDTSARDFALRSEIEKAKRTMEEQQDMYQSNDKTHSL